MRYLLAASALSALLAGSPASSTTLIARSFPDLVREADGIVAGRVVEIVTRRCPPADRRVSNQAGAPIELVSR
jgi:hypothetical protein